MGALRSGTRILLVLDFDGTLTPIVRHPNAARLDPAVRRTLRRLAADRRVRLAIVSGRSLADLCQRVGLPGIVYGGCHGLELRGRGLRRTVPSAAAARLRLRAAGARLRMAVRGFPGARLEPKGLALAVHHRGLAVSRVDALHRLVRDIARTARLGIISGKRVWDLVPPGTRGKSRAVRHLRAHVRREGGRAPLTVYVGDDATDAEVFRTLGRALVGIRVGGLVGAAAYRLPSVAAVHAWLDRLAYGLGSQRGRVPGHRGDRGSGAGR